EGNPGNNVLPRIPALREVYCHPVVDGALRSILGDGYYMPPHRHCHHNPPGSPGQTMHIDSWSRRRHTTRMVMVFYYPQDTPAERGPTSVVRASHPYNDRPEGDPRWDETKLVGDAGTVVLVHYDIWHRGTPNETDDPRYMMKFLFSRMDEPTAATWDASGDAWADDPDIHSTMRETLWNWHTGSPGSAGTAGAGDVDTLVARLGAESETDALDAAYEVAGAGEAAVGRLMGALADDNDRVWRGAGYALGAIGEPALEALSSEVASDDAERRARAAAVIGDIGLPAASTTSALVDLLKDDDKTVRQTAANALGIVAQGSGEPILPLIEALGDGDEWVRRHASVSIAQLAPSMNGELDALLPALDDENRYVRANTMFALQRSGSPRAQERLIEELTLARWCPTTTRETTF
ncbi:MAG: HEAT repeat domain-containing protein, partial [Candidatus Poribacteria bacterium]